ncbi:gem-associated protein 2 isoform X2 [Amblyraja radiata]|uniref:gem-associated protein 2 isoform X2 n=1 Tax=Amblyraja radiata TaxID=386614 RepID=UPI0014034DE6|nr:gem-associated protein 2 isoform X2 [Amblyraja radiata]
MNFDEELMPRQLPVDDWDTTEDFDPSVPPRTPQEYLKRVQIEASRCPEVVVAVIDPRKLKSNQTVNISPSLEDEEGWKKFCLGEKLYLNSSPVTNEIDNPGIDYVQVGFPPLLSIVSRMSQPTVFNILEYLIIWFGDKKLYPELGRWLYALLACIEKPLLPEAHSLIRQLARRCSEIRAKLENPEDGELSALNLLICLVARYFQQCDLADND